VPLQWHYHGRGLGLKPRLQAPRLQAQASSPGLKPESQAQASSPGREFHTEAECLIMGATITFCERIIADFAAA